MDKQKVFKIIRITIIILLLFLLSSFVIYNLLLNKLTGIIQTKLLEQKLNDNSINIDELKVLLFNKIKDDVLKETDRRLAKIDRAIVKIDKKNDYKNILKELSKENAKFKNEILAENTKFKNAILAENTKLKNEILAELDKKLADLKSNLKNEIKAELEIELLAKLNKNTTIEKSIVIMRIDDEESKDIIDEFWKFIKAIYENDKDKILSYLHDPTYNFHSGADFITEDLLASIEKFNVTSKLNEENYQDFFDINAIYFFKSGFRPPLTERVKSSDRLIVFSVKIDKELGFPFPSDENGESTFYWKKTPQNDKRIIATGILSDILSQ